MNFNEIFEKNLTYDIKSDYKTKLYTLFRQYNFENIFLGLRRRFFFFFEWNLSISNSFCRINNLSFYLNKNKLRKNCP